MLNEAILSLRRWLRVRNVTAPGRQAYVRVGSIPVVPVLASDSRLRFQSGNLATRSKARL